MLVADDYHLTQRVAARLKSEGIEAFWTYSRADQPEGRTLVVFLDNLGPDSRVEINRITSVEE
jgi:hypothetical protein